MIASAAPSSWGVVSSFGFPSLGIACTTEPSTNGRTLYVQPPDCCRSLPRSKSPTHIHPQPPVGKRPVLDTCCSLAVASCFMLLEHDARLALSRAACTAGNSNPTRIPIIAITTRSSTSVKARRSHMGLVFILLFLPHVFDSERLTARKRNPAIPHKYRVNNTSPQLSVRNTIFKFDCVTINSLNPNIFGFSGKLQGRFIWFHELKPIFLFFYSADFAAGGRVYFWDNRQIHGGTG